MDNKNARCDSDDGYAFADKNVVFDRPETRISQARKKAAKSETK